ncbi:hypothetical protein GCM10025771_14270 [Niveibacterium umoris]|uniref:diguanylate cyclase n=1 Tax=Niveibacterium umoris TaxID=1193620 RepID=A0A840BNY2_9RHOO|nr:GGDEF domain-containing protein [Niveibacterium umoris]MBB4014700.1 diguanylate cyclase (GGDEF)-like protein [Niveibacterium umoris]
MIDVPTLLTVLCLDCVALALTLLAMQIGRMKDGQTQWFSALICQAIAVALFVWMAYTPPTPTVIVSSIVLLSASFSLYAASMAAFANARLPRLALVLPPVLLGLQHAHWVDDFAARALCSNAVFAFQLGLCAWPLVRMPADGKAHYRWLVSASFLLGAFSMLLRLGELVFAPERLPDLSVSEPINATGVWLNHLNLILSNLGIALMHQARARAAADQLATRDALTELFNRRSFMLQAAREVLRAERSEQPLSVLIIDPDHFRQINATYGSLAGDRVLRHLAQQTEALLRGQDLCARYGDEEIAILLPDTPQGGAHTLAERLREHIAKQYVGPDMVRYTVSIGTASLKQGERDAATLVARAEASLAVAKQAGRNRVAPAGEAA